MKYQDILDWAEGEEKRLFVARWTWQQEYKVFIFFAWSLDDAQHKARRFVGEGGKLEVEEIEFEPKNGIAVLLED